MTLVYHAENVDSAADDLSRHGATLVTEPRDLSRDGGRVAQLRDPSGRAIELLHPPAVHFGGLQTPDDESF